MRREKVCVPDLCRAPQGGRSLLHVAVYYGRAAVAKKLLAAGAAIDATDEVMGEGGLRDAVMEGSRDNTRLSMSSLFAFLCRPCGGVVPRGTRVRKGAHALARRGRQRD